MDRLHGVYCILSTPFYVDGAVDEASLKALVKAVIAAGVDGVTVLGVAGEAPKLTQSERDRVVSVVFQEVDGCVPVIVGTSSDGTTSTITASVAATKAGAAGVMIAAPTFLQAGPSLTRHYREVADAIEIPIVLQDYPPVNGVTLSPKAMAELIEQVPAITTIKLEGLPTPQRISQTLASTGDRVTILGGLGGMYLFEELRRGAQGTMTGFAYPEILVAIVKAWNAGREEEARDIYYRYLPILVFEGQPGIGLAIRKEILRRRGILEHATLRRPATELDDQLKEDLGETIRVLGLDDGLTPLPSVSEYAARPVRSQRN